MRRVARWLWRHRLSVCLLSSFALFGLVNWLAYNHAWAMTHFSVEGTRTRNPEALSSVEKVGVLLTGITLPRPRNRRTPADVGLDFEVQRFMGSQELLEAWYVPRPRARAIVVMFHGYAACKDSLLEQARCLHDLGCAVLLVDFPGSGGSEGNTTTIGVREAEDVMSAVARARQLLPGTPLFLYGMSMGSAAVLRACALHELEPDGLILESPFDRLLSTVSARFRAMGLPAFPAAQMLVFWGGVQLGFDGFAHNPVDYAARIHCPVLVLHGGQDPRVSVPEAKALFDAFPGPKRFELFESAGHEPLLSANSQRWTQAVGDVLP